MVYEWIHSSTLVKGRFKYDLCQLSRKSYLFVTLPTRVPFSYHWELEIKESNAGRPSNHSLSWRNIKERKCRQRSQKLLWKVIDRWLAFGNIDFLVTCACVSISFATQSFWKESWEHRKWQACHDTFWKKIQASFLKFKHCNLLLMTI